MRMGFGGSGTLPRCSRDDPEIIPRLSRDLRMGSGGSGTLPIRSRDLRPCPSSMQGLTTAPVHFPTVTLPRSPPSSRPPTSRISASSSWVSRRARLGHTRSILGRSGEAMRPMGLSSVVQTATRSRTGGGAPSDASRCRRRIWMTRNPICVCDISCERDAGEEVLGGRVGR